MFYKYHWLIDGLISFWIYLSALGLHRSECLVVIRCVSFAQNQG